jgi:hypothetical protein
VQRGEDRRPLRWRQPPRPHPVAVRNRSRAGRCRAGPGAAGTRRPAPPRRPRMLPGCRSAVPGR